MIPKLRTFLILSALCGSVSATEIATTFPVADPNNATSVGDFKVAVGFSVTGDWTFNSAVLHLALEGGRSAQVTVSLFSDSGTTPGTELAALSSQSVASTGEYTFSGTANLTTGTYWLVADTPADPVSWSQGTLPSGNNHVASKYYFDVVPGQEEWQTIDNPPLAFRVNATEKVPNPDVPEPTTLALLGIGLAGLGFARKKKQA